MSETKKQYQRKGISLKLLTSIISIFVFIFSGALVASLVLISYQNDQVKQANDNYIAIKGASSDVQMASDYLTGQVRLFVANADKKYMDNYFEEANVTRRREKAIEIIHELAKTTSKHEEIHENINIAVNESLDLMNMEYYAMKLVCVEVGISYSEYPAVANANIDSVPPEERRSEAYHAVLGPEYIAKKEIITSHVDEAFEIIDELILANSENSSKSLRLLIIYQSVVIVLNILFAVGIILVIFLIIIKPMNEALHFIERNESITLYGNREFNYIVDAYNDVRSQNEKVKERLTYEAEHDKLTNLYNRTGYASLFRRMRLEKTIYALVDVDGFKEINDEYGHDVGDKVLIRIADTLEKHFEEDNAFVFRIGGDEFAVLMENADEEMDKNIVHRFEDVNKELSSPKGKIPPISLSVGIAHGDEDDSTDTLFKKADNVLYKVKQSGKSGVIYK